MWKVVLCQVTAKQRLIQNSLNTFYDWMTTNYMWVTGLLAQVNFTEKCCLLVYDDIDIYTVFVRSTVYSTRSETGASVTSVNNYWLGLGQLT